MMNATHALKLLIIALTLCTVTGCKLLLIVPLGGSVQFSEALDCHPDSFAPPLYNSWSHGRLCEIDITDSMFSASFTAQPDAGYEFVGWRDGKDFQCGGSKKDTCTIALNGSAVANVIVASQNTGFLMPVFKDVGIDTDKDGTPDRKDNDDDNDGVDDDNDTCPTIAGPSITGCLVITDTISRVGKIWAQADLFEGFSWNDMNRACPGGVCGQGALLGDFDMSGWRWASGAEVQVLMNSYAPNDLPAEVTPPYSNFETGDFWAMNAFDGGWRHAQEIPDLSIG